MTTPEPASPPAIRPGPGAVVGWTLATVVPLAFLTVFFVLPVLTLVGRGLLADGRVDPAGFGAVFGEARTWRIIGQTLSQAVLGTAIAVLLGVPGAYLLYRTRFPGRELVRGIVTVPFVLPTVVVGVGFRTLLAANGPLGFLGLSDSFAAIVAALVFFNYSVIVRTTGTMWARLDPRLTEAARVLGAGPWRVWWTVTLPTLAPAIASGAAVVFMFCASAYGVVMILGGVRFGTIETEIWYQTTQLLDLRPAAALSVVQLTFTASALWLAGVLQRRGQRALTLRADRSADRPWSWRRDGVATVVTGVTVVGLLAAPMVNLLVRSFQTRDGWGWGNYLALSGTGAGGALSVPVWQALGNSLRTAAQATALSVLLGAMVALVLSRRPRRVTGRRLLGVLDAAFMLPLGVSAVTVGFGFLITLNRPPLDLRSSMLLVPLAQAVVALPLVVRTLLPVLRAIDPHQREAARTLGASEARVLTTIDLPYALSGLGVAVVFAFSTSLGEFGATSFLARPDAPTLPVVIFRLIGRPGADNFGMAMAASVLLAALAAGLMGLTERFRPQEATL